MCCRIVGVVLENGSHQGVPNCEELGLRLECDRGVECDGHRATGLERKDQIGQVWPKETSRSRSQDVSEGATPGQHVRLAGGGRRMEASRSPLGTDEPADQTLQLIRRDVALIAVARAQGILDERVGADQTFLVVLEAFEFLLLSC